MLRAPSPDALLPDYAGYLRGAADPSRELRISRTSRRGPLSTLRPMPTERYAAFTESSGTTNCRTQNHVKAHPTERH